MSNSNGNGSFAVIFDCDGILLDSEPIGLESLHRCTQSFGFPYDREELTRFCGITDHESFHMMLAECGGEVTEAEFLARKFQMYMELHEEQGIAVFEGIPDLLAGLRAEGIKTAVATSGPRKKLMAGLTRSGLLPYFDCLNTGEEVRRGKPQPDIFLLASRRLGVAPERCFVIEDTTVGAQAGIAAGMNVIAITNTFPRENFNGLNCEVVDSATELNPNRLRQSLVTASSL